MTEKDGEAELRAKIQAYVEVIRAVIKDEAHYATKEENEMRRSYAKGMESILKGTYDPRTSGRLKRTK